MAQKRSHWFLVDTRWARLSLLSSESPHVSSALLGASSAGGALAEVPEERGPGFCPQRPCSVSQKCHRCYTCPWNSLNPARRTPQGEAAAGGHVLRNGSSACKPAEQPLRPAPAPSRPWHAPGTPGPMQRHLEAWKPESSPSGFPVVTRDRQASARVAERTDVLGTNGCWRRYLAKPCEAPRSASPPEPSARFGPAATPGFATQGVGVRHACLRSPLLLRAQYVAPGTFPCVAFTCKVRLMAVAGSLQGLAEGVCERPGTWKMLSEHDFPSSPGLGTDAARRRPIRGVCVQLRILKNRSQWLSGFISCAMWPQRGGQ